EPMPKGLKPGTKGVWVELTPESISGLKALAFVNSRSFRDELQHAVSRHLAAPPARRVVVTVELPKLPPAEVSPAEEAPPARGREAARGGGRAGRGGPAGAGATAEEARPAGEGGMNEAAPGASLDNLRGRFLCVREIGLIPHSASLYSTGLVFTLYQPVQES